MVSWSTRYADQLSPPMNWEERYIKEAFKVKFWERGDNWNKLLKDSPYQNLSNPAPSFTILEPGYQCSLCGTNKYAEDVFKDRSSDNYYCKSHYDAPKVDTYVIKNPQGEKVSEGKDTREISRKVREQTAKLYNLDKKRKEKELKNKSTETRYEKPLEAMFASRYAIAQYNFQFSPTLDDGKAYESMRSKTKKFYDDGGSVDIHHFDLSNGRFPKNYEMADHFLQQSDRLKKIAQNATDPVKFRAAMETGYYAENISRFYRVGRFPTSYTKNARQHNINTVFAFSRDSNGNITAASSGQLYPGDENNARGYTTNGTASSVPGHATVVQHAILHHVVGEDAPVYSQVFNPTVNYSDQYMHLKPWDDEDQKQQDNAIKYHKGIGRRLEHKQDGDITSSWVRNDVTRLIRNTRTKTNVKHIWNS
jgi:hypothetical protein